MAQYRRKIPCAKEIIPGLRIALFTRELIPLIIAIGNLVVDEFSIRCVVDILDRSTGIVRYPIGRAQMVSMIEIDFFLGTVILLIDGYGLEQYIRRIQNILRSVCIGNPNPNLAFQIYLLFFPVDLLSFDRRTDHNSDNRNRMF